MHERTIIVKKGSVSSFLTGALLGAGIALLLAPMTGEETRQVIGDKSLEIKDRAVEIAKDTRERAQTTISDARNKIEDKVKEMKEASGSEEGGKSRKQLKRELEIMEDVNNPSYPL